MIQTANGNATRSSFSLCEPFLVWIFVSSGVFVAIFVAERPLSVHPRSANKVRQSHLRTILWEPFYELARKAPKRIKNITGGSRLLRWTRWYSICSFLLFIWKDISHRKTAWSGRRRWSRPCFTTAKLLKLLPAATNENCKIDRKKTGNFAIEKAPHNDGGLLVGFQLTVWIPLTPIIHWNAIFQRDLRSITDSANFTSNTRQMSKPSCGATLCVSVDVRRRFSSFLLALQVRCNFRFFRIFRNLSQFQKWFSIQPMHPKWL